jgi:tRNA modification GTPase
VDEGAIRAAFAQVVHVSAKTGAGIAELEAAVGAIYAAVPIPAGQVLTNPRHVDAVSRAAIAVRAALVATEQGITPDAVLTELEAAMGALGELTGRTVSADVTARIFERFCVGK